MSSITVVRVELVKERTLKYEGSRRIRCAEDAANIFRDYIGNADREMFVVMVLSTKHNVNAIHTVSLGILDASIVHPREVFKPAILSNASSVIVGHNHPSGDPEPSPEDEAVTRRLVEAGKILGIDVLDHIVIGDEGRFVSLKARGLL
ncbi:JAB domain-containing protein [Alicyclobacillus macrosporangiidus]|uniref:JAB domain-containing protein n=1 Tax=Alicyclobacillus macrosporangiidus TaxID=392015 RepID=UPI00049629D6|nr:JAB domain-containing protein [Alicyclobacillus macrosporangiidus]